MLGKVAEGNSLDVDQQSVEHRRDKPRECTRKREGSTQLHKFVMLLKSTFVLIPCASYYAA